MLFKLILLVGFWVGSHSREWNMDTDIQIPTKNVYQNEINTFNCPNNDSEECEYMEEPINSLAKYLFLKKKRMNSNFIKSVSIINSFNTIVSNVKRMA